MLPITRATVQSFCRVCLLEFEPQTASKENPTYDIPSDRTLYNWLRITTGVKVMNTLKDVYPRKLCHSCYTKLRVFMQFRSKCICGWVALRETLEGGLPETALRNIQHNCRFCLIFMEPSTLPKLVNVDENAELRSWALECIEFRLDENNAFGDDFRMTTKPNVEFPKYVCNWCYKKLRNYAEFRRIAKQSFEYLESTLGGIEMHPDSGDILYLESKTAKETKINEKYDVESMSGVMPVWQSEGEDNNTNTAETESSETQASNIFVEQLPTLSFIAETPLNNFDSDDANISDKGKIKEESKRNAKGKSSLKSSVLDPQKKISKKRRKICESDSLSITSETDHETFPLESSTNPTKIKSKPKVNSKEKKSSSSKERVHKPHKNMKCDECNKVFRKHLTYNAHMRVVHEGIDKPFVCEHCSNSYRMIHFLKRHIREIHTLEKSHKCEICCKLFKRKDHLVDHIQAVHKNERPFKCKYCDKSFGARKTVRIHEMTHTAEKPFACEYCDKNFRQKNDLTRHMERHLTSPELLCNVCYRAQESVDKLKEHLAMHEETMKHLCQTCGKIFKKATQLREHHKTVHLKASDFKCKFCDKKFVHRRTWRYHELSDHLSDGKPALCSICQKSFKNSIGLERHIKKFHNNNKPFADTASKTDIKKAKTKCTPEAVQKAPAT